MASLDAFVGARYCAKVIRKQCRPRIATWLIFEIGVVMSLAAYFSSHDHSVVKAALNVTDAVTVTVIIATLLVEQRGGRLQFTRNERLCLVIGCATMAAWAITRTAWIAFVGFQLVMLVAYLPTIESLWRCHPGESPEPIEMWGVSAAAALIGVMVDVTGKHDYLAMVYPLRAFLCCMVIVGLIARWRHHSNVDDGRLR